MLQKQKQLRENTSQVKLLLPNKGSIGLTLKTERSDRLLFVGQSSPKKAEYNPDIDLIPLQYIAENLPFKLVNSTPSSSGRNTLYNILRQEEVMIGYNISPVFFSKGFFEKKQVTMIFSGQKKEKAFCTPKGWKWLCDRFNSNWNEYVLKD